MRWAQRLWARRKEEREVVEGECYGDKGEVGRNGEGVSGMEEGY